MLRTRAVLVPFLFAALLAAGMSSCGKNRPPDVPERPRGPTTCLKDTAYTFGATLTDLDGDSVAASFLGFDTAASAWSEPVASGEIVTVTRSWPDTGTYQVRAAARDESGLSSDWSEPLTVRVVDRRPPDIPGAPAGPDSGMPGMSYNFAAAGFHQSGITVSLRFSWGDSATSDWGPFVASGETVRMSHAWSASATYSVKVQARDTGSLLSGWSEPHLITILQAPPNPPAEPSGPDTVCQDTAAVFTASALHPNGLQVSLRFAWGDSATSGWGPFVASGETVRMSHEWSEPGTYAVAAQARDSAGLLSEWSPPHAVVVVPPDTTDTMRKWRYHLKTGEDISLNSSPAIAPDGTIYIGSPDSCLYALTPDGGLKWRFETGWYIRSSPAIGADGTVYVGSYDDCVYAVYPDGTLRWKYETNGSIRSSPAVGADGTVYVASIDHGFYAFGPDSILQWRYRNSTSIHSSPAIGADSTIYFGSLDEHLYALRPDSTLKWCYQTGGNIQSSPAIGPDGTIYIGSDDKHVYAVNPDSTLKWMYKTGDGVVASAAVAADGTVYIGSLDNNLYALNTDGSVRWFYTTGNDIVAAPAIAADGTVYIGSLDDCLYALNPEGSLKWKYETGGKIESSPTIAPDGTVYFTSCDGCLYALRSTSPLAETSWPKFHHDLKNTGRIGGGR